MDQQLTDSDGSKSAGTETIPSSLSMPRSGRRRTVSNKPRQSTASKISSRFSMTTSVQTEITDQDVSSGLSDTSILSGSEIYGGTLVFQSTTYDDIKQEYVLLTKETSIEDLGNFICKFWKLLVPEIVLSIISSNDFFDESIESDVDDLQTGIIQAARLTKMWILTDGVNSSVPRIIGEAVAKERIKRKILERDMSHSIDDSIVVIGIVDCDDLWYGEALHRSTETVNRYGKFVVENKGDDSHELNSQHTHFVITTSQEQTDKELKSNRRFLIESKLVQQVTSMRKKKHEISWKAQHHSPVVGILVQGGPNEIDRVLALLRKQVPVIVIKRKGYASGLLAYAYSEGLKGGDSQHLENIVKPQLMQQVIEAFPDYFQGNDDGRMNCRDKILECVKHAVQKNCSYITVLDPTLSGVDQKDLNKFILEAIFNAEREKHLISNRDNVNRYLKLTLDWNSPEFARRRIVPRLHRHHLIVKDELFEEALLLPDREQFVELFLNMGFVLRYFFADKRLLNLFDDSIGNDFFVHICLERVLHKSTLALGKHFLEGANCKLNKILYNLSGLKKLVNPERIAAGATVKKAEEVERADRKALLALIYWAVLTNRQGLAKVLWKRTSQPIAVALVISNIYYHMSHDQLADVDLKIKIKKASIEFGTLAIELMDLVSNDSSMMAYHTLTNPLSDFNNLNVVDLALMGNNIFFIAHPCCQRSMRARWFGKIKVKSFTWGLVIIPEYLKIWLCLFLVFPMYFWLTFDPIKRTRVYVEEDEDQHSSDDEMGPGQTSTHNQRIYGHDDPYELPPLWRKLVYLWNAPISKYLINQLFTMAYLVLYALVLLTPYCGNKVLNTVLCVWTGIQIVDRVVAVIRRKLEYQSFDFLWPCMAILGDIYICSVSGLLVIEQTHGVNSPYVHFHMDFPTYKFLLSLGVLWAYFRSLKYILPLTKDLGPMLVNLSEITSKDLFSWLSLWAVCIVSGGLAIGAIVYPSQPLTAGNIFKNQLRALLGIFLTEIDDLKGDTTCSPLYDSAMVKDNCDASSINREYLCPVCRSFIMILIP